MKRKIEKWENIFWAHVVELATSKGFCWNKNTCLLKVVIFETYKTVHLVEIATAKDVFLFSSSFFWSWTSLTHFGCVCVCQTQLRNNQLASRHISCFGRYNWKKKKRRDHFHFLFRNWIISYIFVHILFSSFSCFLFSCLSVDVGMSCLWEMLVWFLHFSSLIIIHIANHINTVCVIQRVCYYVFVICLFFFVYIYLYNRVVGYWPIVVGRTEEPAEISFLQLSSKMICRIECSNTLC